MGILQNRGYEPDAPQLGLAPTAAPAEKYLGRMVIVKIPQRLVLFVRRRKADYSFVHI